MISDADLAGYQARAHGKKIVPGQTKKNGVPISEPEEQLAWQLTGAGITYYRNFPFHPTRKWTADFVILPPRAKDPVLLVECEGRGRHQSIPGFEADIEKYTEAMLLGYVVLRFVPRQIASGKALGWIMKLLAKKERNNRA